VTGLSISSGSGNTQSGYYGFQSGSNNTQSGNRNAQSGSNNTQSGDYGLQSGYNNTQSGYNNAQSGYLNAQSGDYGFQSGHNNNQSGDYGLQSGLYADDLGLFGARTHSAGRFSTNGDAQTISLIARGETTNATPTQLFLDGASAVAALPDNCTWLFTARIVARRTDDDDESASYTLTGCIDRNIGDATTALVGTVTKTVIAEDSAAWDVAATANVADGSLELTVTGETDKVIRWVASIDIVQVLSGS